IGVLWLALAAMCGWTLLFSLAQWALAFAVFWGVIAAVGSRAWYTGARHPGLDPRVGGSIGGAPARFWFVWTAIRTIFDRAKHELSTAGNRLLAPAWPTVVEIVEVILPALFILVALYAAVPGAAQELSPLEAARGAGPAIRLVTPITDYEIA